MADENGNDPDDLPPHQDDDGTRIRIEHEVYLKAVNNPARRRLLEIVAREPHAPESIAVLLVKEGLLQNEHALRYHLDVLVNARCVELVRDEQGMVKAVKITQAGQVVDWMEK